MRSYRPFLSAIPHRRAGYPRVTHPSATRVTPEEAPSSDLHVLRTPPAFVLSQDQTRHPSSLQSDRHTLMRAAHFTFYLRSRVLRLSFCFAQRSRRARSRSPTPAGWQKHFSVARALAFTLLCCFSLFSCSGTLSVVCPPCTGALASGATLIVSQGSGRVKPHSGCISPFSPDWRRSPG
jgi:hypothetical protein